MKFNTRKQATNRNWIFELGIYLMLAYILSGPTALLLTSYFVFKDLRAGSVDVSGWRCYIGPNVIKKISHITCPANQILLLKCGVLIHILALILTLYITMFSFSPLLSKCFLQEIFHCRDSLRIGDVNWPSVFISELKDKIIPVVIYEIESHLWSCKR